MTSSLGVGVTAIAEATVYFLTVFATWIILNATISGVRDLSVVKCRCFFDLLLDEVECVHLSYLKY